MRATRRRSGRHGRLRRRRERPRAAGDRGLRRGGLRRGALAARDRRLDGAAGGRGRGRGLPRPVSTLTSLMLDAKLIRSDPDGVRTALERRGGDAAAGVDRLLELVVERRELLLRVEL